MDGWTSHSSMLVIPLTTLTLLRQPTYTLCTFDKAFWNSHGRDFGLETQCLLNDETSFKCLKDAVDHPFQHTDKYFNSQCCLFIWLLMNKCNTSISHSYSLPTNQISSRCLQAVIDKPFQQTPNTLKTRSAHTTSPAHTVHLWQSILKLIKYRFWATYCVLV